MTDDKKTKPEIKRDTLDVPKGIPVRIVRFVNKGMQVKGMQSGDVLKAQKYPDGREHLIEYIPQIRHHKITYNDPNYPDRSGVTMVHETRVDGWEPL